MLSKAKIKYINALQTKKVRIKEETFLVQGTKSVLELIKSEFTVKYLVVTKAFLEENNPTLYAGITTIEASEKELAAIGTFQSNNQVLAVVEMRKPKQLDLIKEEFILALDDIRDPGNLGTLIRLADWYGIKTVLCAHSCVDFYNPKVISSTMGSFTRIVPQYCDLKEVLQAYDGPVYGAYMEGENVHHVPLEPKGVLVIGNESKGINPALEPSIRKKLSIVGNGPTESLNAAIAAAILVDNFYRNM